MANTQGNKPASEATLREHFAGLAMQGCCAADTRNELDAESIAAQALQCADALLSALEAKQ